MKRLKSEKTVVFIKRLIPVLIYVFCIIFLTTQSREDTLRLSGTFREYFKSIVPDSTSRWTYDMHWFRTLMHLPLYFLLGCVTNLAIHDLPKSAVICLLISLADETMKIFLPTREFGIIDLCCDIIGFMIGIIVTSFISNLVKSFCCKKNGSSQITGSVS